MFLTRCTNPPCWAPSPPPAWTWFIYLAVVIVSGLIIFADWRTSEPRERGRARTALVVWLSSVVVVAFAAEAIELYTYAIAPR